MKWKQSLTVLAFMYYFPASLFAQPCSSQSDNLLFSTTNFQQYPNIQNPPSFFASFPYEFDSIPPVESGFFTMTNNTSSWPGIASNWIDTDDNSPSPYGYMMVVNAHPDPGPFWTEWIGLCGDAEFIFSFDAINLYDPALPPEAAPNLEFFFDGFSILNFGDLPQDGQWHSFTASIFVPPGGGDFPLDIVNNTPGGLGNVLAIDNISLVRCGPEITLNELSPQLHCPGDSIEMSVSLGANNYTDPWFQWQISTDGGQSWGNYGAPDNATNFTFYDLPIAAQVRAEVVPMEVDLGNPTCTVHGVGFPVGYFSPVECSEAITEISGTCNGQLGPNAFPNGDFGSGSENILPFDPGYAPGYVYEFNPPPNDGTYCITNNSTPWGSFAASSWNNIYDNSPDTNGYMMVVNASPTPGTFYEETLTVCELTNYEFSCDVISMNWPVFSGEFTEPNISFVIDGVEVFSTGNVPIDSAWHTYGFTVTTATGINTLTLSLRNNTPGGLSFIGNDLAIDNISFRACGPTIALVDLTAPPYCQGDSVEWQANIGPGFDSPEIQWQISFDGGITWQDYGAPSSQTSSSFVDVQQDFLLRALVAETTTSLLEETCRLISDTLSYSFLTNSSTTLTESICQGQAFAVGGEMFTATGQYEVLLSGENGCDSTVFLDLTVEQLTGIAEASICAGEVYLFGSQNLSVAGVYTENFVTANNCDSLVTLTLEVLDTFYAEQAVMVCSGETVNGIPVFSDTMLIIDGQSIVGCDSTVVWQVTVMDSFLVEQSTQVCPGETVLGIPIFSDTILTEFLQSVAGCDSTVVWSANVLLEQTPQFSTTLCSGEEFNGTAIYSDTIWVENLQTWQGCDSIVSTEISVYPVFEETIEVTICEGEIFNGVVINSDTTWIQPGNTINGCDSTTILQITVEALSGLFISGETTICEGEVSTLSVGTFFEYSWSDGTDGPSIEVIDSGEYSVTVTSINGCTASASAEVTLQEIAAEVLGTAPVCFGEATGQIQVENLAGEAPFSFSINGGNPQTDPSFENLTAGNYEVQVEDAAGCIYEANILLAAPPVTLLDLGLDLSIELGDSVQLVPTANASLVTWEWSPPDGLSCTNCEVPVASPVSTTSYTLLAIDENGCPSQAEITIVVNTERRLYIPNAFSPNGDGFNDFFTIYAGPGVDNILRFEVYDRWGEHVFSAPPNTPPNDLALQWDGTFKGEIMQPAVFAWFAEIAFSDGSVQLFEGDVTIVR